MEKKNNNGFKIILLMLIVILIVIFGYLAYNKYMESKDKTNNNLTESTDLMDTLPIEEQAALFKIVQKIRFMGYMIFNDGIDYNIQNMDFTNFNDSQMAYYLLLTQEFRATDTICFSDDSEEGLLKNCILDNSNEYSSSSGYNEARSLSSLNYKAAGIFGKEINVNNLNSYTFSYFYDGEYYVLDSNGGTSDPYEIKDISLKKVDERYVATIKAESVDEESLPGITYEFTFSTLIASINAYTIVPISFVQVK